MNACWFHIIIPSSGFERSCILVAHLLMIGNFSTQPLEDNGLFRIAYVFFLSFPLRTITSQASSAATLDQLMESWKLYTMECDHNNSQQPASTGETGAGVTHFTSGPAAVPSPPSGSFLHRVLFANKPKKSSHRRTFNSPFIT